MRFSEAKGYKVVSKASADTVGKITDYVIDPKAGKVAALVLKKTSGDGDTLPWADLSSFGTDAVTVDNETVIVEASAELAELTGKRHAAHGKRVLTTDGADLGDVEDIEFDPETGKITALVLKEGEVEGHRLMAVGSYAVVVKS